MNLKNSPLLSNVKRVARLMGPKLLFLFVSTVPLGLLQGLLEIVFGYALLNFLYSYGLAGGQEIPAGFLMGQAHPVLFLIGAGLVRLILLWSAQLVSNVTHEGFNVALRQRIVEHILNKSENSKLSVADTSNFMSNLLPRSAVFMSSLSQAMIQLTMMSIAFIALLRISWPLSLVTLGTIFIFGFPVIGTRRLFQGYSMRVYGGTSLFTNRLLKDIRNFEFLRIIEKIEEEVTYLIHLNRKIFKDYLKYIFWISANSSWPQFGAVCVIASVVALNSHFHWIQAALLIPFVYLLSRMTAGAGEIARAAGNLQFNAPFLKGLVDALPENAARTLPSIQIMSSQEAPQSFASLDVENLSVGRGPHIFLKDLTLNAVSGDFVCFRGESGKGKTTLLMTLIGLLPSKAGRVLWNKRTVTELGGSSFRNRIAYSGADPFLLDISVRDNVLMGNEHHHYRDSDIWDIFHLSGCDFVKDLPGGLDYPLHEGGEGISAGQKQRLSIARALLRRPDVLLLDEATANIDMDMESLILKNVRNHLSQAIVLAVSHRPSILSFSTHKIDL